ncbi:MAG: YggN family protein [Kangiellaceae bacterium]|nr:YggN family protein [Kangiellaceae bacterium]
MISKTVTILAGLTLFSASVVAEGSECHFSVSHDIEISEQKLIFQKDNQKLTFTPDQLFINGKVTTLTSAQSQASKQLYRETRRLVPKISEIALEGAELGIKAATLVITSLFGVDEDVHNDLIKPIEALSQKIKDKISVNSINTKALNNIFDEEVDQELERLLSRAMSKYAGQMASQLISKIFSGDSEEIEDLEFKMENLEHDIEAYVESQSGSLEDKANALCKDLDRLAEVDAKLESVKGYPVGGLIQVDSKGGFHVSSIDLDFD